MSHSLEETRRRFYQEWSPFDRIVAATLAFAVASIIALALISSQQDARLQEQDKAQQECLRDRQDALRDYLETRGALADRDRTAVAAVISSLAASGRSDFQNRKRLVKTLQRYEKVQEEIAAIRKETPLPEFPAGECLDEPGSTPGGSTPSPDEGGEGAGESKGTNDSGTSAGTATASPAVTTPTKKPRGSGTRGSPAGPGPDDADGEGDPAPEEEPPLLELEIPDLLSVRVTESGPEVVAASEGFHADTSDE